MKTPGLWVALGVWCAAFSFLFSGMEAGVFALSRLRIRQQMRAGKRRARLLHHFLEDTENFLWTLLVGSTLANFILTSLIVVALYDTLWQRGWTLAFFAAFLIALFLIYALCDLLPKLLFRLYPNRLCLAMAVPFRFFHLVLSPLVGVVTWFSESLLRLTGGKMFTGHLFGTRDEFRWVMQQSAASLSSEERAMINRVLDLQHRKLREITLPLDKAKAVPADTPVTEVLGLFREGHFSRLPVWQETEGSRRIIGVINLSSLLYTGARSDQRARDFVQPALYLEADLRLEEALRRMQKSGWRLAIVLGLDRRELGIVTLQDILGVIFGEVTL